MDSFAYAYFQQKNLIRHELNNISNKNVNFFCRSAKRKKLLHEYVVNGPQDISFHFLNVLCVLHKISIGNRKVLANIPFYDTFIPKTNHKVIIKLCQLAKYYVEVWFILLLLFSNVTNNILYDSVYLHLFDTIWI